MTPPDTQRLSPARSSRQHWLPWVSIGLTLVMLAAAVLFTRSQLRIELRQQLANRDAQILRSLLQRQLSGISAGLDSDPLLAVLDASTLPEVPGVIGVRLFTAEGAFFTGLLAATNETQLPEAILQRALQGGIYSRFHETASGKPGASLKAAPGEPVLEVVVPLQDGTGRPGGIAQFFFDAANLAAEFQVLDRHLQRQAALAFILAALVIAAALGFAFQQLSRTTRLLEERTQSLQRANQELTLAAKTSAIGAVTSHLLHGLKNPLAGLQQFVSARPGSNPNDPSPSAATAEEEWRDAAATTRRMKSMIDSVMHVLREESSTDSIQVPLEEILERVVSRYAEPARRGQVRIQVENTTAGEVANRTANLAVLILENLTANALQASPAGTTLTLSARLDDGAPVFRVRDHGPGLPPHVRERLFTPVQSTKEGGSGIGLALCQQLALHLGAELTLVQSNAAGTEFALRLPVMMSAAPVRSGDLQPSSRRDEG